MPVDLLTPQEQEVILSFMEGLDSPRSLTVSLLIRHNEWKQLLELKCLPVDYGSAESYYSSACATSLLQKLDVSGSGWRIPGVDPAKAASLKWEEAERQCFRTNQRINEIHDFGTLAGAPVHDAILEFFKNMRKNIRYLLGDKPPSTFDGRFGPGATVSDTAAQCTVLHKMSSIPTLTRSALFYLIPWYGTKWAVAASGRTEQPIFSNGNHYFSVPKTALTERPCAKEPSINSYFQLGLGRIMRTRLKRIGIDLERGQELHRELARKASLNGDFATIDLSSASDTLCESLVRTTLPPEWFNPLNDLRSSYTKKDKRWYRLEKFSSMGNGFTFELETAIFLAISMSVSPELIPGHNLFVYGDDIIVPTEHSNDVLWALRFCGFTPNPKKTFTTGLFRESCGGDFWNGVAVRPFHLKELPNEPQKAFVLANGIRRVGRNFGPNHLFFARLRRSWFKCLDLIPSHLRRCRGPVELGDLVIHDEERQWITRWRSSIRYIRVVRPHRFRKVSFARFCPDVQFAGALYGVSLSGRPRKNWPDGFDNRGLVLRGPPLGYKVGWVPYS